MLIESLFYSGSSYINVYFSFVVDVFHLFQVCLLEMMTALCCSLSFALCCKAFIFYFAKQKEDTFVNMWQFYVFLLMILSPLSSQIKHSSLFSSLFRANIAQTKFTTTCPSSEWPITRRIGNSEKVNLWVIVDTFSFCCRRADSEHPNIESSLCLFSQLKVKT